MENIVEANKTAPRCLRSNYSFPYDEREDENEVSNFDVSQLPFVEIDKGSINYYTDLHDICFASDELLKFVEKSSEAQVYLAFDMEWPFNFKTGPGITSVIQICAELDKCFVFQLTKLKKIPLALTLLLNHPKVVLHGNNIKK